HDALGRLTMTHRRESIEALDVRPGQVVLDLACGAGANFEPIRRRLGSGGKLVGLDYTPGMLQQARKRIMCNGWKNVHLLKGDSAKLPFRNCTYDRIICTYALKVIPPFYETLDEINRVLKPEGFINRIILWMARKGPMSDLSRPLIEEIKARFESLKTQEYDFGHTFIAIARKQ
ncbi:MAG: methyltransferase domain-containing protein, partial [Deltaproteobacteria bacterium]|nr:methyltransferase domain-containing protein [Deltaproteobacteria bacterium]